MTTSPPPAGFLLSAATDAVAILDMGARFAEEWLRVEHIAPDDLKAPAFVVIALAGGRPHLVRLVPNPHDTNGRFCKPGSPTQSITVEGFGWFFAREDFNKEVYLLGCLIDQSRAPIITWSALARAKAADEASAA